MGPCLGRTSRRLAAAAIAAAVLLAGQAAPAGDWPQWRGPTTLGYTDEKGLPTTWDAKTGDNILWKAELPKSHNPFSSPIVSGDRVFVTWSLATPVEHHVTCYDAADGKPLWDTVVPPGRLKLTDLRGGYGAPTPCADGERVYVVFGSAVVAALDFSGKPVWRHELERISFDVAIGSSPVLSGDTVVYLADQNEKKSSLIAFDKRSGQVRWQALRPQVGFAHSTPAVVQVNGAPQLLVSASNAVQGIDPTSGKVLWWCKSTGDTASPAFNGTLVYCDSGRSATDAGICVDVTGSGDVTETHRKWSNQIGNDLSSPLIVGDYLYRLTSRSLVCVRLASGEVVYKKPLPGAHSWSSPIATADGLVYFATSGKSHVLKAGPAFEIVATSDLGDPHFASPAVSNGRIFLRGQRNLFCIGRK